MKLLTSNLLSIDKKYAYSLRYKRDRMVISKFKIIACSKDEKVKHVEFLKYCSLDELDIILDQLCEENKNILRTEIFNGL